MKCTVCFAITTPCTFQNNNDILQRAKNRKFTTDVDNNEELVVPLSLDSRVLHNLVFAFTQTTGSLC
jgi:hypothetical protein